ncbi:MAG TPA: zf-HC2 domain-containing protein [Bryobacteraceae bacterium]|jgi:anti-sigma factor RsiW|nr:zf-HC2 domain-containing protein [Bryobacteraceae bacterium]
MSQCEDCAVRIEFYLDNELQGDDLESFESHLAGCRSCREQVRERRRFLEELRSHRPLYHASAALREKVEDILAGESAMPRAKSRLRRQVEGILAGEPRRSWFSSLWTKPLPAIATTCLVVAGAVLLWTFSQQEARANAFVNMAVKTHQQELAGRLPVEIKTNSPAEVTSWFSSKVPFHFRLPTYQQGSGDAKYILVGGRLVNFRSEYAAYVVYRMQNQLVSLIITSTRSSKASGGEVTESRSLTFHSHRRDGLQVVTWSAHSLTYALVSSVTVPARESCKVCHASSGDHNLMRNLKGLQHLQPVRKELSLLR